MKTSNKASVPQTLRYLPTVRGFYIKFILNDTEAPRRKTENHSLCYQLTLPVAPKSKPWFDARMSLASLQRVPPRCEDQEPGRWSRVMEVKRKRERSFEIM